MANSEKSPRRKIATALVVILLVICGSGGYWWYQRPKDIFDAAWKGDAKSVQSFLDAGIDVNALNNVKDTPLHLARNTKVADLLIARGADIKARNAFGGTPLHMAAVNGRPEVASYLINKGANVNALDMIGATPVDHALVGRQKHVGDGGQDAVLKVLQSNGGVAQQNKELLP